MLLCNVILKLRLLATGEALWIYINQFIQYIHDLEGQLLCLFAIFGGKVLEKINCTELFLYSIYGTFFYLIFSLETHESKSMKQNVPL